MARSKTPRFPVTVTQMPVVRCAVCSRSVAYAKGSAGEALTAHYAQAHADLLDRPGEPADAD